VDTHVETSVRTFSSSLDPSNRDALTELFMKRWGTAEIDVSGEDWHEYLHFDVIPYYLLNSR
jgi:hypothetical protein